MPFQEYPKWLHHTGHKSVLVEDEAEESAALDRWTLPTPGNALLGAPHASNAAELPKARGGWPKGKKRGSRNDAVVN